MKTAQVNLVFQESKRGLLKKLLIDICRNTSLFVENAEKILSNPLYLHFGQNSLLYNKQMSFGFNDLTDHAIIGFVDIHLTDKVPCRRFY